MFHMKTIVFCIAACQTCAVSVASADVDEYVVAKVRNYEQVSGSAPAAPSFYTFDSYVDAAPGDAGAVSINGFPFDEEVPGEWSIKATYATQAELDAIAPSATAFMISISGGTLGNRSETVLLPMPEAYPAAPALTPSSYNALQNADPNNNLLIEWPAPDANTNFVIIALIDVALDECVFDMEIDPAQTSFEIQAMDLDPEKFYQVELIFANAAIGSGNAFPGFGNQATMLAGFVSSTTVDFVTSDGVNEIGIDAGVIKGVEFIQTSNNTQPTSVSSWFIEGFIDVNPGDLASGELQGGAFAPALFENAPGVWDIDDSSTSFASKAALDASFPSSTLYNMHIEGGALGTRDQGFTLGPDGYPQIPYLVGTNYDDLQVMDPDQDFTLTWVTPNPGVSLVGIAVDRIDNDSTVLSELFENSVNSLVIPAGTLEKGAEYELLVTFVKGTVFNGSGAPGFDSGMELFAGYLTDTTISFTAGDDGNSCLADLTGDGVLNFFDVSAFLVAFNAQQPDADLNMDGSFNFFDVSTFLVAFNEGCP